MRDELGGIWIPAPIYAGKFSNFDDIHLLHWIRMSDGSEAGLQVYKDSIKTV